MGDYRSPSLHDVQQAEQRAEEARDIGFRGRPVYRATPGCSEGCARCDIACAILQGTAYDLRRAYEASGRPPAATLH